LGSFFCFFPLMSRVGLFFPPIPLPFVRLPPIDLLGQTSQHFSTEPFQGPTRIPPGFFGGTPFPSLGHLDEKQIFIFDVFPQPIFPDGGIFAPLPLFSPLRCPSLLGPTTPRKRLFLSRVAIFSFFWVFFPCIFFFLGPSAGKDVFFSPCFFRPLALCTRWNCSLLI